MGDFYDKYEETVYIARAAVRKARKAWEATKIAHQKAEEERVRAERITAGIRFHEIVALEEADHETQNRKQRLIASAIKNIEADKIDIGHPYGMPHYLNVPLGRFTKDQLIQIIVQREAAYARNQ